MPTFDAILNSIDRRLYKVEQSLSNPAVVAHPGGTIQFDQIILGPTGDQVTLGTTDSSAPTGLTLSVGASFDTIYIDVSWTVPTTNVSFVVEYEIEISKKVSGIYQLAQVVRTAGNSFRYEPVEPDTTYGVRVFPINRAAQRGTGTNAGAYQDITTGHDSTVPPAPTGVSIQRGAATVIVFWTALTAAQARDVANGAGIYEVQIDTVNTFNSGNLQTRRTDGTVLAFNNVPSEANYYARVSAIDSSGNQGAWSTTAGPTLAGSIIATMVGFAIGGGNLVPNSSFEADANADGTADSWAYYNNSQGTEPVTLTLPAGLYGSKAQRVTWSVANTTVKGVRLDGIGSNQIQNGWQANQTYVVSFYARGNVATTMALYWNTAPTTTTILNNPVLSSTTWQRYVFRITWGAAVEGNGRLFASILTGASVTGYVEFDAFQVELGEVVTAYAPRPDEILPSTITATEIADNAVTTPKLIANAVTAAKIAANTITAAQIAADTITAAEIAANAITASEIAAGAVTTAKMTANSIDASVITTNTMDVQKLTTSTLSARDITLGSGGQLKAGNPPTNGLLINSQGVSLYAASVRTVFLDSATGAASFTGTITGSTITGGLVQTASSGARVSLGTNGWGFNSVAFYSGAGASEEYGGTGGAAKILCTTGTGPDVGPTRPFIAIHPPRSAGALGYPYIELWGGGSDNYGAITVGASNGIFLRLGNVIVEDGNLDVLGGNLSTNNDLFAVNMTASGTLNVIGTGGISSTDLIYTYDAVYAEDHVWAGYLGTGATMIGSVYGGRGGLFVTGDLQLDVDSGHYFKFSVADNWLIGMEWGNINLYQNTNLQDNFFRLRASTDDAHGIYYDSATDGPVIRGYNRITLVRYANTNHYVQLDTSGNWVIANGGVLRGTYNGASGGSGGGGGAMRCDNGTNVFHTNWDGTMRFYIDTTLVKNFVIDHPKDHAKYLVHACLEGPTADVFYRGRGKLNKDGNAWIELPDYFVALIEPGTETVLLTPIIRDKDLMAFQGVDKQLETLRKWNERAEKMEQKGKTVDWDQQPKLSAKHSGVPYLAATEVVDGHFIVVSAGGFHCPDAEFFWEVKAERKGTRFAVEPRKDSVSVDGFGPYTFIRN